LTENLKDEGIRESDIKKPLTSFITCREKNKNFECVLNENRAIKNIRKLSIMLPVE